MTRRRKGRQVDGILLLDKPLGLSSNAALQKVKRAYNAQKAGHTGSLDPLATGLLPLCLGHGTKVSSFLLDAQKSYEAELLLGQTTSTGDSEGEVLTERACTGIDLAAIDDVLSRFTGEITQIPPMYSALKRDGQPLYKLARQGIEVPRDPRAVTIFELERVFYHGASLTIRVRCSKGTYIRTLAEDVGEALGCGAHLKKLRRTAVGPFRIEDAITLEELCADELSMPARDALLLQIDGALNHLPEVNLSLLSAQFVTQGNPVNIPQRSLRGLVRMYAVDRTFLGIGEIIDGGRLAPRRIFCQTA